ncbi:zf-HC2 domain-containing protein [Labedaea rhizosphaerae]|uniref:Putative zinc finger protein n=1 Tax=Labedaea rhizosphaerae TaxID=598644 RepID=A0A4V3CYF0_LABRH|nr:zf-HC2 domain-containing protein [Labedaea rhizosphaerae]TDP93818.1 putative zinc finger protein [Labedaea rhizosphaerae]
MTDLRGWGTSVPHLLPDAVVAYVDGELSPSSHDRASAHVAGCAFCAAEVTAQRQARAAVRAADTPCTPAGLLAALRAIPQHVDLPSAPDNLAVSDDGQLVVVQRPDAVSPLGSSAALGSSAPLGHGSAVLGQRPKSGRALPGRAAQGAGVVVSGLVLGALALVTPGSGTPQESVPGPQGEVRPAAVFGVAQPATRPQTRAAAMAVALRDAKAS